MKKKILSVIMSLSILITAIITVPFTVSSAGDSFSTATSISLGYTYSGEISSTNKADYYKFTLSQSGSVKITVNANINLFCAIYGSNDTSFKIWSDTFSANINDTVELSAGTYYFKVYDRYCTYSFKFLFTSANESFPETIGGSNNTFSTASTISLGTTYRGHIAVNDKQDYYKFTLSQSGSVKITVNANINLFCAIYSSNDTSFKIWSDTFSANINDTIELSAGTYYFKVYDRYCTYSFSISYDVQDTTNPTGSISSTNNVASSQTVTLTLNDNLDVAGYYWGTSSSYYSNTYTSISNASTRTTVTKTVSSSGTYYLTVKDTSGNISSSYSIIFYKTTLNANGGSVSPSYIITKSGYSFTFPTPTKTNNKYMGWSTSSTATSGVKSLSPTGNSTYYAVWSTDITNPTGAISSTNNASSSQTVTLNLNDNVGIAGYYWGTSSTYSSNTYTSISNAPTSTTVLKTVSSSGTYYLTVKDTSDNISSKYSVVFYKITLNANGGSVSPQYVIINKGKTFTFPIPEKSGYTCVGWNTSSVATTGEKSIFPTSSTTYYAIWKILFGDVNNDGEINAKDLILFRKLLLSDTLESFDEHFDVTGDGKFNLNDLVRIKKYLADNTIPLGEKNV